MLFGDEELGFQQCNFGCGSRCRVHVFEVTAQIAALCERLVASVALKRSLLGVLAEVVTKVAALAEDRVAALVLAAEVDLAALLVTVNFDDIVPFGRNSLEAFCEGGIPTFKRSLIGGKNLELH